MTVEELFEKMQSCNLFVGKYDATNGSKEFMYGIKTVMEYIAYSVSENIYFEFSDRFTKNMIDSENKI